MHIAHKRFLTATQTSSNDMKNSTYWL